MAQKTPEQYEAVSLDADKPQRAVFLNVVEPKAPPLKQGQAKPVYSATFLIDPAAPLFIGKDKSITQRCLTIAKEEFPGLFAEAITAAKANGGATVLGVLKHLKAAGVSFPFDRGDEINAERARDGKKPYDWAPGKIMFRASKPTHKANGDEIPPPALGSVESGKGVLYNRATDLALNGAKFYHGAEVFFSVQFAGFSIDGKRHIKAYLNKVFVTGKGERLGGGGAETFNSFLGNVTNTNPTDDEVPLY
jgi:hypothetical protein